MRKNIQTFTVVTLLLSMIVLANMNCSDSRSYFDPEHLIGDLMQTAGTAMHEKAVLEKIIGHLPDGVEYTVDDMNNLLVTVGPGEPEMMFIAHMDEIGLEVTGINSDGTINTRRSGGSYSTVWESRVVEIHTTSGMVEGFIPPRPTYASAQPAPHSWQNVIVSVGTETQAETETLGIETGDFIVQKKKMTKLGYNRYAGGSVDDRAGCAILLMALEKLLEEDLNQAVTFAWCVAEEIGLIGAGHIASYQAPKYVFAVDTYVSSDAPRDQRTNGPGDLGKGAILRIIDSSNIAPRSFAEKVQHIAEMENIPVQKGITSGGTDSSRFLPFGSYDLPLSWPGIYSHSFVSVFDMRDIHSLTDLITALSLKL